MCARSFAIVPYPNFFFLSGIKRFFSSNVTTMSVNKKPNKLINEKSPYLLQHCYNPVNWYPWGEEAFTKSKKSNFPIFLSVGYSTCHWCHVMEHESFENEVIANYLNENFVSIKVDREERPDVDKLYMTFIQAITGGGGWPMSVFLTPDLEPLTGGTYFPPHDNLGQMGFLSVLKLISEQWKENKSDVLKQGKQLANAIVERSKLIVKSQNIPDIQAAHANCYKHFEKNFDDNNGGFGIAPKFPKPVDHIFLLHYYQQNKTSEQGKNALKMVKKTLQKMAHGGIHDHIGKGFHRYSVDEAWHVPHFEKMLYDEGQLLELYANNYKITNEQLDIVLDIVDYLNNNLSHLEGGFFCGEDADSLPDWKATKKREGAFCVWTMDEIAELLNDHAARFNENLTLDEIFIKAFNVGEDGNVLPYMDIHNELKGKNVLKLLDSDSLQKYAIDCKMSYDQLQVCLEDAKKLLAEHRSKWPQPHLDRKIITSWNALAISGFCAASTISSNLIDLTLSSTSLSPTTKKTMDVETARALRERACKALEFIKCHLVDKSSGELLRSIYADEATNELVQIEPPIKAFSDDYAFLIQALLDMYEVDFDESRLQWALELQAAMDKEFWDKSSDSGYFLSRSDDSNIFARLQEDQDGAEPCTNSVAFSNLLRLAALFDSKEFLERAENILRGNTKRMEKYPYIVARMVSALYLYNNAVPEIVVVGRKTDETTQNMIAEIQAKFLPRKMLVFLDVDKKEESILVKRNEHFKCLASGNPSATVYFCKNFACEMPVSSLQDLKARLNEL